MAKNEIEDIFKSNLYKKVQKFRKEINKKEFILDAITDKSMGAKEYPSIGQYYLAINDACLETGLEFVTEVEHLGFERATFDNGTSAPKHLSRIKLVVKLVDIDNGEYVEYSRICSGVDSMDKAELKAVTGALRQWFEHTFAPRTNKSYKIEDLENSEVDINETTGEIVETNLPKTKTFIPETKKEEITKEVVNNIQLPSKEQKEKLTEVIMLAKEKLNDSNYGQAMLEDLSNNLMDATTAEALILKIENKLEDLLD